MAEQSSALFGPWVDQDNPTSTETSTEDWTGVVPGEKRQEDSSSAAGPEPLTPSKLASIGEPETKLEEADNPITLELGRMLQNPGMEAHADKLVLCGKLNQLRRPAVKSYLAQDCIQMPLKKAEWDQLDAALSSTPRVLDILKSMHPQDRPIMRDTIRFGRGLALLDEHIENIPEGKAKDDLKCIRARLADVTYLIRMARHFAGGEAKL